MGNVMSCDLQKDSDEVRALTMSMSGTDQNLMFEI